MAAKKEATTKTKVVVVEFAFENETKGAVRLQEVNEEGEAIVSDEDGKVVGSLYLRKSALKKLGLKDIPDGCTVTIAFK